MKTILLEGPGKNSLSTLLMEHALEEVRGAGTEPILLTGAGDAFSAGLNLKEVAELDVDGLRCFLGVLERLVTALYEHPGPTVAWVNGHAIAGGCVLALCCDARVMTSRDGTRIGLNEVAIGLRFPPRTFTAVSRALAGPSLARIILEAGLYPAQTAKELGMVDTLGEEAEARAWLERLAAHPRDAYAAAKVAVRGKLDVPAEEEKRFFEEMVPYWAAPELKARLKALLKR
ncbi:Enoyl-CoA hydratase [Labilithrix luteola]|uniref:Enoyl-CoA hydratase n=1 Tax=Labilithrix luteola TaxID=1391654 RepID=A0A0K1Q2D2_9BACT|nr:enoyl-CoA hydratase/isomerase family protein [Labilithrix luteola]AKU99544.1 Enoyl-CoA hydratase [Labilithrix luteola]